MSERRRALEGDREDEAAARLRGHPVVSRSAEQDEESELPGALAPDAAREDPTTSGPLAHPTARVHRQAAVLEMQRLYGNRHVARLMLQRQGDGSGPTSSVGGDGPQPTSTGGGGVTGASGAVGEQALIVEDSAQDLQPGQMRKSEFLAQLRSSVNQTVEQVVSSSPAADQARAQANEQIEQQFAAYGTMAPAAIERTIKARVPATSGASQASAMIQPVCDEVRQAVSGQLPTGVAAVAAGVVGAIGSAVSSIGSFLGGLFSKARQDEQRAPTDPRAIQARLTAGGALDGQVQSSMESAFGESFSGVRVHTDANAAGLADSLGARAFTVGRDVAFAAGEYQPGTPVGDALIAHELAHVAQQRGAVTGEVVSSGSGEYDALEADADTSAGRVVASLWRGAKGLAGAASKRALPQIRSGLKLQRCGNSEDTRRMTEIRRLCAAIPRGQEAIAYMEEESVGVNFRDGGGSEYSPSDNEMYLDRNQGDADLAVVFVHEMNHARYSREGMSANVSTLSREEYVREMIEEEAEGTVRQIEAKTQLEGASIGATPSTQPLEPEYRAAYEEAVLLATIDGTTDEDELAEIGREAGKQRVIQGFSDGTVVTSTTHQTYADYYGQFWDSQHPGGGGGAPTDAGVSAGTGP